MEITIIVPVYQVEKYIEHCLYTIKNQSFKSFDLILVDDGSWDASPDICDEYALANENAIVFHKTNGGASTARNVGIDFALVNESKWLAFLDSDDWISKEYFNLLYSNAVDSNVAISVCNAIRTDDSDYEINNYVTTKSERKTPEELWCMNRNLCVVPWGKLYKKSLFNEIRYPEGKIKEDEFVSYKVLFQTNSIQYIPTQLYVYFQTPSSVMRSDWSLHELDDMEALDGQVDYFWENGFLDACVISARENIFSLSTYIRELKKRADNKEKRKFLKSIKKRRLQNIQRYRQKLKITVKGNEWMYALVYPFEMKIYAGFKKVIRCLKLLKKENY